MPEGDWGAGQEDECGAVFCRCVPCSAYRVMLLWVGCVLGAMLAMPFFVLGWLLG